MMLVVKNPPANTEDVRDKGSIPESGRSPRGGHGTLVFLPGESHEQWSLPYPLAGSFQMPCWEDIIAGKGRSKKTCSN